MSAETCQNVADFKQHACQRRHEHDPDTRFLCQGLSTQPYHPQPQPCCSAAPPLSSHQHPSCHCCCERIAAALTGLASRRRAAKQQWQNSNSSSSTPSPSPLPSSLPLLSSWDYIMPPICLHPHTAPSFASSTFAHDCLTITPPLALTHVRPCCRQQIASKKISRIILGGHI